MNDSLMDTKVPGTTPNISSSRNGRKRKRVPTNDVFGRRSRLLQTKEHHQELKNQSKDSSQDKEVIGGAGRQVHVLCPLCQPISRKTFSLGRGIATHLHDIHTPWNPTKLSRKIARRIWERDNRERQKQNQQMKSKTLIADTRQSSPPTLEVFTPTDMDIANWNREVDRMVAKLENDHAMNTLSVSNTTTGTATAVVTTKQPSVNHDVRGIEDCEKYETGLTHSTNLRFQSIVKSKVCYKDSLPPFINAARQGNFELLQNLMREDPSVIMQRDRHGSTAEHWAAGGGHLICLKWILEQQHCQQQMIEESKSAGVIDAAVYLALSRTGTSSSRKINRRRDGKTSLHYAARNGQIDCVRYLVDIIGIDINVVSGEGTTPLHMACYGGHLPVIQYLVDYWKQQESNEKTNPALFTNDWECSAAHWTAMTLNKNEEDIYKLCDYLQDQGVDFSIRQRQGHSPLHKAAHRLNRHVLEWIATSPIRCNLKLEQVKDAVKPDHGGHTPSDIWKSMGGDHPCYTWMKKRGW